MADADTVLIGRIWVQDENTALVWAPGNGHSDVCAKLLKANASPDRIVVSAYEMTEQWLMRALC